MKVRHELKYMINSHDACLLEKRLSSVMKIDSHAQQNHYQVHSLYFDNCYSKVAFQKLDGVNQREKFRIRYYNQNFDYIKLEKKCKLDSGCTKQSTNLSLKEVKCILNGDLSFIQARNDLLLLEFYDKYHSQLLRPQVVVDYRRVPFIYGPGNVRITLDQSIQSGSVLDFLNPTNLVEINLNQLSILEIKYDQFIPSHLLDCVQCGSKTQQAFSKYVMCAMMR